MTPVEEIKRLREEVRKRLTMAEVCVKDGLEGRREGAALRARCPFHEEKRASFLIGGRSPDTAKCFGCGWGGDIFAYWSARKGVTHKEAVNQLASLVNLAPVIEGVKWERPKAKALVQSTGDKRIAAGEKPLLPRMRALKPDEIQQLAALRGLSPESVRLAAQVFRRVGFCEWKQVYDQRRNVWRSACQAHYLRCDGKSADCKPVERWPSWVVTDEARWVAQFRRLDGGMYPKKEGEPYKTDTAGTAKWPLGCAEIGDRTNVLLVEGGADMLAAYHFLHYFRKLHLVAVVAVLGASVIISDEALKYFAGKRVRIIADNDQLKVKEITLKSGQVKKLESRPGLDAAARWQDQLTAAGACVETFNLEPLGQIFGDLARVPEDCAPCGEPGAPIGDLNDLALCSEELWETDIVREAFCEWRDGFGG